VTTTQLPDLPSDWPEHVKAAVLHATGLAHAALARARGWCADSPLARVRLAARVDQLESEVAMLREELRIKDARMAALAPERRPHYPPADRLAVLALRAARCWTAAETARRFLLSAATIASWTKRLDEQGPDALVQVPVPVNRYPDFVRVMVAELAATLPTMGRVKVAQVLARAGLPTAAGFWVAWLHFSALQRWTFGWTIAVVLDHYSRAVVATGLFRKEPTAAEICGVLDRAVANAGRAPKYTVTDRGEQFQGEYGDWCTRHGVKPRFGAIGKHGSSAVIERFMRTLKDEGLRRMAVPLRRADMAAELGHFARWYNEHRPHETLRGATPAEVRDAVRPAKAALRLETRAGVPLPRGRPPRDGPRRARCGALEAVVERLEGRRHLPIVSLRRAG